jgi:hypothetical protein
MERNSSAYYSDSRTEEKMMLKRESEKGDVNTRESGESDA